MLERYPSQQSVQQNQLYDANHGDPISPTAGDWGEAANGIEEDPTASTEIWDIPWDQHMLVISSCQEKRRL